MIFNFKTYSKDEVIVRVSDLSKLLDLEKEIEKLQAENKILKEALDFYAVSGKYHYGEYRKNGEWSFNPPIISNDSGETAREALEKLKQKDEVK